MRARTFAVLIAATGFAFGAAACSDTAATPQAAPVAPSAGSAPAPVVSSAPANSAPATSAPATSAPARKPTSATTKPGASCPSGETLISAREHKFDYKAPKGSVESKIACHDGWAMAAYEPTGQDSEVDTFHYVSGQWQYLGGSSAEYCELPPAAVKKSFAAQGWVGCAA